MKIQEYDTSEETYSESHIDTENTSETWKAFKRLLP